MTQISVIICTHNPRLEFMRRVLEGLRAQTFPCAEWELLLVDNASQDKLADQFDLSWHPRARHVREEKLGLTPARLRGIQETNGQLLVLVDDDTVLRHDYLEQTLAVASAWPFIGSWGGSILPEFESPLPPWVQDQVWRLTVAEVKTDVWSNLRDDFTTHPCGAGLCFRRSVGEAYLQRCQSKQSLSLSDRKGLELSGYGDMDLNQSAIDLGLGVGKSSRLQLTHLIPSSRLTLDYFIRHAEGDATSLIVFRASRALPVAPPPVKTWLGDLRWFIHRKIHQVPREQYEIAKAHQRGLEKGWELIKYNQNHGL